MKLFFLSLMTVFIIGCGGTDEEGPLDSYPPCLQPEIDRILEAIPQSPRANIKLYHYRNVNVYVLNTNFPDDISNVYNYECEIICSLGGINGNPSNTCSDWRDAIFTDTIWVDNR